MIKKINHVHDVIFFTLPRGVQYYLSVSQALAIIYTTWTPHTSQLLRPSWTSQSLRSSNAAKNHSRQSHRNRHKHTSQQRIWCNSCTRPSSRPLTWLSSNPSNTDISVIKSIPEHYSVWPSLTLWTSHQHSNIKIFMNTTKNHRHYGHQGHGEPNSHQSQGGQHWNHNH